MIDLIFRKEYEVFLMNTLTSINLNGVTGIYCWIHRVSGMCYVGSALNVGRRIKKHISDALAKRGTMLISKAIREFGTAAFDVELLCECAADVLIEREQFYITFLNSASADGFNIYATPRHNAGGGRLSESTKERMGIAQKGRKHTPETKAAMSAYWTGKKLTESTKEKLRSVNTGKKYGPETGEKHRQSGLKRWAENPWPAPSAEQRAKISATLKGRKPTAGRNAKVSAALKGKKRPAEVVAKIAAGNRGQKRTDESRALMREKALAYQARKRNAALLEAALPFHEFMLTEPWN